MDTVLAIELIVTNPEVRGGRPVIAGTGITVEDVAIALIYHQQDADGIAEWYNLNLAQVHAALTYYYQHQAEIDANMKRRRDLIEDYKERRVGSRHKPLFG
jgi:uncharacterized protein (DUF433 family)